MTHLDTSFLIDALVAGSAEDQQLRSWLRNGERIGISSISWAEFLCGPVDGPLVEFAARIVGEPAAFLADDAKAAAHLFNLSGRRRGTLVDCMIAAVAMRLDATLATTNAKDFAPLAAHGLRVTAAQSQVTPPRKKR